MIEIEHANYFREMRAMFDRLIGTLSANRKIDWGELLSTTVSKSTFYVELHCLDMPPVGIDGEFQIRESAAPSELGKVVWVRFENGFECSGVVESFDLGQNKSWLRHGDVMRVTSVKPVGPASWLLALNPINNTAFDIKRDFAPRYKATRPERNELPVSDEQIKDEIQ